MEKENTMPKGPRGEKRPADSVGCAVQVAKIATGEVEDTKYVAPGRKKSGEAGGRKRGDTLSKERRSQIAKQASNTRWRKERTMSSQIERAKHALFSSEGVATRNVKFFLGSSRDVTAEQLADQLNRADAQVRNGDAIPSTQLDGSVKPKVVLQN